MYLSLSDWRDTAALSVTVVSNTTIKCQRNWNSVWAKNWLWSGQ